MLKNVTWVARFVIWAATLLFVFDNLGVNITAFVASLGIGGVAVALAAQSVLGDAFSSFAIFMDKPFQVGDFIIVGDLLGTVEHVGFKTTRLRSLGGEQLIFSNSDLTSSRIKNYKRMKERRVVFSLAVVYHTPVEADATFVTNFTRSYLAPALEELYNFGPHVGNLLFEIGNPDLERESTLGLDLSVRHQSTRLRGDFNVYVSSDDPSPCTSLGPYASSRSSAAAARASSMSY